jgi:SAM-dependent methyltransferase
LPGAGKRHDHRMTAAEQWRDELAAWAIPEEILARAPESPWGFPPELFAAPADPLETPSRNRALEVLPEGGAVMDVGCGGGAGSFALVPPAALVVGVDESASMLERFGRTAAERGIDHRVVEGQWPGVGSEAGSADVVVCHHVLYNVADLGPFVRALDVAARRRVVVEITATHPMTMSRPLWKHFHDLDRPDGPSAELAFEVIRDLGIDAEMEHWSRPSRIVSRDVYVRMNRQRLCLPVDAEPEVDRVMGPTDRPREVVTIWWNRGGAG